MDKETNELFNALIKELDRVEQKIYGRLSEINNKIVQCRKMSIY